MKPIVKLFAVLAILGLSGVALAEPVAAGGAGGKAAAGKRARVAGASCTFVKMDGVTLVVTNRAGEETKYATDAATIVQIEGAEGKLTDLKVGQVLVLSTDPADANKVVKVVVSPADAATNTNTRVNKRGRVKAQ